MFKHEFSCQGGGFKYCKSEGVIFPEGGKMT